ncbi:MAG: short-chain fatty acid transporter [Lachnospiraceae bacterium]|nr:short-chain fatty acid transporter [Lachnospiraceae bacterium]
MIKGLTRGCTKLVQKFLPDAFLFSILLSAIVFILGIVVTGQTPLGMIIHWGNGFWNLLAFSMQMVLVVVLGGVVANAPVVLRLIKRLAKIPKTPAQAVILVTFASGIAVMIQWGFGLVFAAVIAREVAKEVKKADFPLLIAAGYSTFMLSVLTSSMVMKAASNPEELLMQTGNVVTEVLPIATTAYHPCTLMALGLMFVTLPFINARMHPSEAETRPLDPALFPEQTEPAALDKTGMSPAQRFENSRLVAILTFVCGVVYIFWYFVIAKKSMAIDMMNFMLFMVGILLHGTPMAFIKAVGNSIKSGSGILIQFPFYAGIMGMMTGLNANGVSLAAVISQGFVSIANTKTMPIFTFLSAALVNMFVPSAGGQWAVQAPVMFPAAKALGTDYAITTIAMTWGDTWTNMIQPFWALPALGIAGLGVRDIMGYCVVVLIWTGIIILASLLLWSYVFL